MYTGYKGNTSINKSMSSVNTRVLGGESQLETLQREVDNYTRKLEQEKRRYASTQDTYEAVKKEYEAEKEKLDEVKKQSHRSETTQLHAKIKNLEANLQKAVNLYDETMSHNNKLKADIDTLRREKKNLKDIYVSLEEEIARAEDESSRRLQAIEQKYGSQICRKKRTELLKNEIEAVKDRNAKDRDNFMKQFKEMEKNYLEQKKIREVAKLHDKSEKSEPLDTQPVLKMRLKKLIAKNKQKVKSIEQYQRNIKQIEEAFEQIRKGSGITDLEEITNTFIKSEEQNYSLYNYVDILSQNIDGLEQQNRQLQRKIQQQRLDNEERKKQLAGTPDDEKRRAEVRSIVRQKQKVVDDLNELVQRIQPDLEATLMELARSKYNDDPKKLYDYQLGFNLSDRNVEQYLSDLEKYINILVDKQNDTTLQGNRLTANTEAREGPRAANAPILAEQSQPRDQKQLLGESELKKFAEEYIDKKKARLRQ